MRVDGDVAPDLPRRTGGGVDSGGEIVHRSAERQDPPHPVEVGAEARDVLVEGHAARHVQHVADPCVGIRAVGEAGRVGRNGIVEGGDRALFDKDAE
jgi:hypothetical protein